MTWDARYFTPTPSVARMLEPSKHASRGHFAGSMMLFHPNSASQDDLNQIGTAANLTYIKVERVVMTSDISHQKIASCLNKQQLGVVCIWIDERDPATSARIALAVARKEVPLMLHFPTQKSVEKLELSEQARAGVVSVVLGFDELTMFAKGWFPNMKEHNLVCAARSHAGRYDVTRALGTVVRWF